MKIAILGYGLQGQSVYEYFKNTDNSLTICDRNMIDLPDGVESQLGESYLDRLDRFDLIFRGPGIHPSDITASNGTEILEKVTTNTNEFLRLCPTSNVIGVTGTKGKGTTTTLIAKMLEASGLRVHLGGNNIGVPPLDLLAEDIKQDDWVILELANYQIIDLRISPHIGVCLMVEPEHLDWHADVDEYYQAKAQLFEHQTSDDLAIYYALNVNSKRIASTSPGKLIPYFESPGALVAGSNIVIDGTPIIRINEIKLIGKHNLQNVCAAVTAVWQISQDTEAIADVLREFTGLPFRLEIVREVNGVKYIDDSFGSAPPATSAAIEAIKGMKVLILGGKDRGLDLDSLAKDIAANGQAIRRVIIIGESAGRLVQALDEAKFKNYEVLGTEKTMSDIVETAAKVAQEGDSVILSPGFPSFDMFKNFEDRGLKFNEAVNNL